MKGSLREDQHRRRAPHLPGVLLATALLGAGSAGCTAADEEGRTAEIARVIGAADAPLARDRPELVAGKYAVMASHPYSFYRGSVPLYLSDYERDREGAKTSAFAMDEPLVLTLGDAHLENFGTLLAADGSIALEPNDFDAADQGVYLWDVRRLVTAMALSARLATGDDEEARDETAESARDVARAAMISYALTTQALAEGAPKERLMDPGESEILEDLFERSSDGLEDHAELSQLTEPGLEGRRLRRGGFDDEDPGDMLLDLPDACLETLASVLEGYRATLADPPPPAFFQIEDAARELGSGVASFPRVRVLVLVRGPSDSPDDDVILEVKEIAEPMGPKHAPSPVLFGSQQERIQHTTRAAWATETTAPLWSTSEMLGFPVQVRLVSGGQKTLRLSRLTGKRGTPEAIQMLAANLGALLARVHASPLVPGAPSPAAALWSVIGADPEAFADEQADFAVQESRLVMKDHARFREAIDLYGPTLGAPPARKTSPTDELAQLYSGIPPQK